MNGNINQNQNNKNYNKDNRNNDRNQQNQPNPAIMPKQGELQGLGAGIMQALMDVQKRVSIIEATDRSSSVSPELMSELATLRTENASLTGEVKKGKVFLAKLSDEVKALKQENADLAKDNQELKANNVGSKEKTEKILKMESEIEELRKLAYFDKRTSVKNENAFNRDIKKYELKNVTLIDYGISGLKAINKRYGKSSGDKTIKGFATMLISKYGADKIYRIMGDQFYVISDDVASIDDVVAGAMSNEVVINAAYVRGANFGDARSMIEGLELEFTKNKNNAEKTTQKTIESAKTSSNNGPEEDDNDEFYEDDVDNSDNTGILEHKTSIMDTIQKNNISDIEDENSDMEEEDFDDEDLAAYLNEQ